ncbi:MAG: hypothetical protein RQ741_02635 [Wenzhouxiangellaceae bacterium]|nr:hypothetical protein [Wenzhouxiangellaceae bacterium]
MNTSGKIRTLLFCLAMLAFGVSLAGCDNIQEPWLNEGQAKLLDDEVERDERTQKQLRSRLVYGQSDR